jgi:hypothetical protein
MGAILYRYASECYVDVIAFWKCPEVPQIYTVSYAFQREDPENNRLMQFKICSLSIKLEQWSIPEMGEVSCNVADLESLRMED